MDHFAITIYRNTSFYTVIIFYIHLPLPFSIILVCIVLVKVYSTVVELQIHNVVLSSFCQSKRNQVRVAAHTLPIKQSSISQSSINPNPIFPSFLLPYSRLVHYTIKIQPALFVRQTFTTIRTHSLHMPCSICNSMLATLNSITNYLFCCSNL